MTGYDAQGNFLPPQQLVDEIERLRAALADEREHCAEELERAHAECNTLNLLHGAARIRALAGTR